MKYKFGDCVITKDGKIGIVVELHEFTKQYFVKFQSGGCMYDEDELMEWHGCW